MLALTSEALIQSPWLRASHWAGIKLTKLNHCFHCHPNPSNIHPTYRVWCHLTIAGVEQIIQLIGVPQCLWQLLFHTSKSQAPAPKRAVFSSNAVAKPPVQLVLKSAEISEWTSWSWEHAGAVTSVTLDLDFVVGPLACGSTYSIWINLSLVHHCLISPYQISVNPPATPIRVDARKQPQNSNRILTVVGCGRFSDSEISE